MKTKMKKIILGVVLLLTLAGMNVFAASFNFSFPTSSTGIGGTGYTTGRSSVYVGMSGGNLTNTRYINVWGANNAGSHITGTNALSSSSTYFFLPYTSSYSGNVFLWGNPSSPGASAYGYFEP